jgi:hypothetical protein
MKKHFPRGVMEGENKMKKNVFLAITFSVISLSLALTGCPNQMGGDLRPGATLRYETVPFVKPAARAGDSYSLVYSAKDDTYYYYVFLLGHVNKVPVAYRTAVYYDGTTPQTVGYSLSDATEESITKAIETTIENSVMESKSVNWGVAATVGVKGTIWSASLTASVGGEFIWEDTQTRSVAETYETARSTTQETTDSLQFTVGEHGEPMGKYRYSLWATNDIYLVVKTNQNFTAIEEAYITACARQYSYVWAVDYDPDMEGDFGKTAGGDLLEIPDLDISSLPVPTNILPEDGIPIEKTHPTSHYLQNWTISSATGGTVSTERGDTDVDSGNGKTTYWELYVEFSRIDNNRNIAADFTYTVTEGKAEQTILKLTQRHIMYFDKNIISIDNPQGWRASGSFTGKNHGWNQVFTDDYNQSPVFFWTQVRVDGSGGDSGNIGATGDLRVYYTWEDD